MSEDCGCETEEKSINRSRALKLEYFTVGYNIFEGIASIAAGVLAGSIALIGFGFDSAIESISGGVLIWRLLKHGKIPLEEEERIEKKAVRLVAYSFFILAAYVAYESIEKLYYREVPEPSLFGIIVATLSLIIMPVLAYAKWKQGKKMGLRSLVADSKQTLVCSMLSLVLLIGLGLNYLYGIWWADPACALVIVALIVREGVEALKEEKLCAC